jgi:hydrogenase nickel incorporation protein HypA/HybF
MHEIGLMQEALDIAFAYAARHGAQRIERVTLRVGDAAGVDAESLSLGFDVATGGTIAEGARLEIEHVAVVCYCTRCDVEFRPTDTMLFACPRCQQVTINLRGGQTLELGSIEIS